jgi:galactitol-specific phosphotransferase system IIC component
MENFIKNLSNLVKVKTLITIAVTAVFVVLALRGDISPEMVMTIVSMVVAFYFGTQHEKTK